MGTIGRQPFSSLSRDAWSGSEQPGPLEDLQLQENSNSIISSWFSGSVFFQHLARLIPPNRTMTIHKHAVFATALYILEIKTRLLLTAVCLCFLFCCGSDKCTTSHALASDYCAKQQFLKAACVWRFLRHWLMAVKTLFWSGTQKRKSSSCDS